MLKHYHDNLEHKRGKTSNEPEEELYLIERIIDEREKKNGSREYLVQWKGYDEDENTWEPADVIESDAPGAVEDFKGMMQELATTQFIKMETDSEEEIMIFC
jgi:hypothetical protein